MNFIMLTCCFGQTDIYDSINVGNVWRKYNIHLPLGYNSNASYPLILGFHGGQQAATSSQGWTVFAYQSTLFSNYPIDTTRVYATGSSNGGMLCYRLSCELSHRFAAIAPNACSQMYFPCNQTNKIPVISFHSKVDPIVPSIGGMGGAPPLTTIYFPSQDSTMNLWSQKNNCQSRVTIENGNGNNYDFIKIQNCSCNVEIHHYATTDGSHSWPGGNPNNNPVSTQISATDLLWSFFQNYKLGCLTTVIQDINENDFHKTVYPNPFTNKINLKKMTGKEHFTLINYFGQIVWTGYNIEQKDFSELTCGLYFLKVNNRTIKLVKQ